MAATHDSNRCVFGARQLERKRGDQGDRAQPAALTEELRRGGAAFAQRTNRDGGIRLKHDAGPPKARNPRGPPDDINDGRSFLHVYVLRALLRPQRRDLGGRALQTPQACRHR